MITPIKLPKWMLPQLRVIKQGVEYSERLSLQEKLNKKRFANRVYRIGIRDRFHFL